MFKNLQNFSYSEADIAVIWLDSFIGLEYKYKKELLEQAENCADLFNNIPKFESWLSNNLGANKYALLKAAANKSYADNILNGLQKQNIYAVTFKNPLYPSNLSETGAPPLVLYCKGNLELLKENNKLAIVGSRKSTEYTFALTYKFAAALSEKFTIVTGIAEGGDSSAIKGALSNKGKIICVLPGGFNYIYPESNISLVNEVINKNSLVITEHTSEVRAQKFYFPLRNRILAGLSRGVLVTGAGESSGTLITANYAGDYGRDVFAVPYNPGITTGEGCNNLIRDGATLVTKPAHIFEHYSISVKENEKENNLNADEKVIYEIIQCENIHLDKIIQKSGMETGKVNGILSMLELKGLIVKNRGNIYCALI